MKKNTVPDTISNKVTTKLAYVFISHNANDATLANAFSELLRDVSLGMLDTFFSTDKKVGQGVGYGDEWYPKLIERLAQSSHIVCILTENSINKPWILFEAGVAKGLDRDKKIKVFGLALGFPLEKTSVGPFSQFQNCDDEEESLIKLVSEIINTIPGTEIGKTNIRPHIKDFIEKKNSILAKQVDSKSLHQKQLGIQYDFFEELKNSVENLPTQIEDKVSLLLNLNGNTDSSNCIIRQIEDTDNQFLNFAEEYFTLNAPLQYVLVNNLFPKKNLTAGFCCQVH